jgi:hypothetical protein
MTQEQTKHILKLAGKLATASAMVVGSDVLSLSAKIKALDEALCEYNYAMFELLKESDQ